MTLAEIKTMLDGMTGFSGKVAYSSFPENLSENLPFICFLSRGSDNFGADNIVYHKSEIVDIELYSKLKDTTSEELIEQTLISNGLYWDKTEEYLNDEKCFVVVYTISTGG